MKKINIINKVEATLYGWKAIDFFNQYDFRGIPELLKKITYVEAQGTDSNVLYCVKSGKDIVDFYYNQLQVRFTVSSTGLCLEAFIVDNDTKFKVYTWCNVDMATGNSMSDSVYVKGTWNKYVMENFKAIMDELWFHDDEVRFNKIFKNIA